jgi:hypothetical protein
MKSHLGKLLILGTALSLSISPVLAQGRGGGGHVGGGVGAGIGAGNAAGNANIGGQSGMNGRFGGQSDAKVSAQGRANTNGPNAMDRDFGSDRAADRANRTDTTARTHASNDLGDLNAAHASDNARANAASGSRVGEVATYESQMKSALAMSDQSQRNAAITRARQQLAQNTNKPLTADAITQLDSELHIQGASPQLGAAQ